MSRRWIWIAIAVVIGVAALAMIGDVRELGNRLGGFGWWAFGAALGLALTNYAIRFLRWQLYLRHQKVSVPVGSSALVFGAGLSLSITPAKLGELVKSYLLRELHDIPATADRADRRRRARHRSDRAARARGRRRRRVRRADRRSSSPAGADHRFGLVLLAWPRPTRALIDLVTRPAFARRFRGRCTRSTRASRRCAGRSCSRSRPLIAIPAWACECVGFALIVNAFPGAHVDLGLAMVIYAATTIAGALSFLPGGLGVTEGAMTILLVKTATRTSIRQLRSTRPCSPGSRRCGSP